MRFFNFISIAWRLSKHIPWIGEPEWTAQESSVLRKFLVSDEGKRFRMVLLNMVLKQNQQAVSSKKNLNLMLVLRMVFARLFTQLKLLRLMWKSQRNLHRIHSEPSIR